MRIHQMHKKYEGLKNDKRIAKHGFTLVEIVTTVAIIGILAAVAVPNYMRLRMDVNMEMVKQHVRIVGEKLTEIMGKQGGQLPTKATWGQPSADEDEISLTANLAAIDEKGYTTEGWTPNDPVVGYSFTSCPKGDGGDRCFKLDPIGVQEIPIPPAPPPPAPPPPAPAPPPPAPPPPIGGGGGCDDD